MKQKAHHEKLDDRRSGVVLSCLLLCSLLLATAGCEMARPFFLAEEVVQVAPAQTNLVEIVTTNLVERVDESGAVLQVPTLVTNLQPVILPAIYATNYALGSGLERTVQTAGTVAGASGVPFATTAAGAILALSTLILGIINRRNALKVQDQASALNTARVVGTTLVENFETLRKVALTVPGYTREVDDRVMRAVKTAQALAGVKTQIHDIVERTTEETRTT
jgi:hypothetical protein